jgi:basic amino acid/polyamine antiporter, APA family
VTAPRRKFGILLATALVVGNIVGSAIFVLPRSLAPFGWNIVSAWLVTVAGTLCLAWVFAQMFRHLPGAGGSYGFMRLALGDGAAFLGGWGYIVSIWAANAAITIGGVEYLTRLVPRLAASPAPPIVAVTAIWLLTWINLKGMRAAGGVQLVSTIVKLLPFVAVIGLVAWRLFASEISPLPPVHADSFSFAGASAAVGFTMYAMLGFESAAVPADVVENPERNVPIATMLGTGLSAFVTVIATCAVALMLPLATVATSAAPISDFIAVSWGSVAGWFVALCAVFSCFGCLNGWLFMSGELLASMTVAGVLPRGFGQRNAAGAPAQSLLIGSVVSTLLTMMAYTKVGAAAYNFAVLIATATNLVMYLLCTLALVYFMRIGRVPRSTALIFCAAGSLMFVTWAFYGSGQEALVWGAVLIAAGWPLYVIARRFAAVPAAATA